MELLDLLKSQKIFKGTLVYLVSVIEFQVNYPFLSAKVHLCTYDSRNVAYRTATL